MRIVLRIFAVIIIAAILTLLTQVGGIIFLISLIIYPIINRKINNSIARFGTKVASFIILYLTCTLTIVPIIARQYDRVPLPMFETDGLRPRTTWTCILNRNYVRTSLRTTTFNVARKMQQQYPGTIVNYLDASFPVGKNFRIFPHLSHGDGRKIDIAFHYIDATTLLQSSTTPSFDGYGVYEGPRQNEFDQQAICKQKGYWQGSIFPGKENDHKIFLFDEPRTNALANFFASDPVIEKIFIEPHLETRLGLTNSKIRFQGCYAARHDDHIHVQVK
ncbi:MAG: hypothetical protein WDO15_15825 [Bacteroidota bacterium]